MKCENCGSEMILVNKNINGGQAWTCPICGTSLWVRNEEDNGEGWMEESVLSIAAEKFSKEVAGGHNYRDLMLGFEKGAYWELNQLKNNK